jgi:hypothetical protein
MYWIIEKNLHKESFYEELLSFLERMNIPYELNFHIPFSTELETEPKPTQEHVMAIGSYGMCEEIARRGYKPGVFMNRNFDYRVWALLWGSNCLNEWSMNKIHKFKDVPEQKEDFFIRPCTDTKEFTGQVMSWEEFSEWRHKVVSLGEKTYTTLNGDTAVVISEPVGITAEYRFIIIDGKPVTGSLYKSGHTALQKECDDPALYAYAERIASVWSPHRVYALDIAISNGTPWVLEMGCMNAAGLYKCDIQKIVMALEDMKF